MKCTTCTTDLKHCPCCGALLDAESIYGDIAEEVIKTEEPVADSDAPFCTCGSQMVRRGRCYYCMNCFKSTGSCD